MSNFKSVLFIIIVVSLLLAACGGVDEAPYAESDSSQNFNLVESARIPVDDNVYVIEGWVVADVDSLIRQDSPGYTRSYTSDYGTTITYVPPVVDGKGFVRLLVESVEPETSLSPVDEIVILKTTDTKVRALLPGDAVTFKCRAQFEAVAAIRDKETFDKDKLETWELDYCRLVKPVIELTKGR